MYSNYIPNGQTQNSERRKDARKKVNGTRLLVADCRIMANGEIVRTSFEGAGIRFRMFFKK